MENFHKVTSEGEKLIVEGENEEEGREAEASPSTNSRRTVRGNNSARRSSRPLHRGSPPMRMNPTPIVWSDRSPQRHQGTKLFFIIFISFLTHQIIKPKL